VKGGCNSRPQTASLQSVAGRFQKRLLSPVVRAVALISSASIHRTHNIMKTMYVSLALLLLLAGPAVFRAAQQWSSGASQQDHVAATAQQSNVTTDGLSCSRFEWDSDKTVMKVPISLDGKLYWYQLDTGADVVIPYGSIKHEGWSARGSAVRIPNVRFAGMFFPSILGYPNKDMPLDPSNPTDPKGTVGLELLIGHTFVIDFPKRRICLLERADLPESLTHEADWSPAEIRHGKLFVDVALNGQKLDGILYDTGSSSDALCVDLSLWKEATGRSGTKDATTHTSGQSWGRELEIIGAPASGELKIGKHVYQRPLMTTVPAQPEVYRTEYRAQGLLGNALFAGSIIILDLGAHPSFGIIDSRPR